LQRLQIKVKLVTTEKLQFLANRALRLQRGVVLFPPKTQAEVITLINLMWETLPNECILKLEELH